LLQSESSASGMVSATNHSRTSEQNAGKRSAQTDTLLTLSQILAVALEKVASLY
jgi:hypothetical protein